MSPGEGTPPGPPEGNGHPGGAPRGTPPAPGGKAAGLYGHPCMPLTREIISAAISGLKGPNGPIPSGPTPLRPPGPLSPKGGKLADGEEEVDVVPVVVMASDVAAELDRGSGAVVVDNRPGGGGGSGGKAADEGTDTDVVVVGGIGGGTSFELLLILLSLGEIEVE